MTSTTTGQEHEPSRSWAGSLIEWHLYTEFPPPAGDPCCDPSPQADSAPEHWLWLRVYGQNSGGGLLTLSDASEELTVADTGLTLAHDGWLEIDENRVFSRLHQIFPGAEVWFAPDGNDARIDTGDTVIEPIFDLELRTGQAGSPPQIAVLARAAARVSTADRSRGRTQATVRRTQPRRMTRQQRKGGRR